jgi:predicted membrane protein
MEHLSKQQESFCENAGIFGVLISLACLIQHMVFMIPHWVTFTVMAVYILCIASFILLAKKQPAAPVFLIISSGLIFLLEILMMLSLTFSLVLLLLLLYLSVITIVLYIAGTPAQLKKRSVFLKEEAAKWQDVI